MVLNDGSSRPDDPPPSCEERKQVRYSISITLISTSRKIVNSSAWLQFSLLLLSSSQFSPHAINPEIGASAGSLYSTRHTLPDGQDLTKYKYKCFLVVNREIRFISVRQQSHDPLGTEKQGSLFSFFRLNNIVKKLLLLMDSIKTQI